MLTLDFDHLHMQAATFKVITKKEWKRSNNKKNWNGVYNFQTSRIFFPKHREKKINLKEHKNEKKRNIGKAGQIESK